MKLFELVGVKKFYDKDMEDVLASMAKTGHTELGRGSFAVIVKNGSRPGVIKFWIKDSSYDKFIDYVESHPSKYFPKLLSKPKELSSFFLRPEKFPDKIRYVKMEELKPLSDFNYSDLIDRVLRKIKSCKSEDELANFINLLEDGLKSGNMRVKRLYGDLPNLVSDISDFCNTMYDFVKDVVKGNIELDIHEENVMERSSGEIVITDPVFNSSEHDDATSIEFLLHKGMNSVTGSGKKKREVE